MASLNETLMRAKQIMDHPSQRIEQNTSVRPTPSLATSMGIEKSNGITIPEGFDGFEGMEGINESMLMKNAYEQQYMPQPQRQQRRTIQEQRDPLYGDDIVNEQYEDYGVGYGGNYTTQQQMSRIRESMNRQQPQYQPQYQPQPQQQYQQQMPQNTGGGVDYSMVKMIVEDCLKRYSSILKKSILKEMSECGIFRIGEKVQVVDKNGNLYEGKLQFKKKING